MITLKPCKRGAFFILKKYESPTNLVENYCLQATLAVVLFM